MAAQAPLNAALNVATVKCVKKTLKTEIGMDAGRSFEGVMRC